MSDQTNLTSTSYFTHHADPEQWSAQLEYAVTHVFLPAHHETLSPASESYTAENDHHLVRLVCAAAHAYSEIIDDTLKPRWSCIVKMLEHLQASVQYGHDLDQDCVISQLRGMQTGGTLSKILQTLSFTTNP